MKKEFISNFAERFNETLETKNITAAEFSRITGVSEGTISCYKKGLYEPKQKRLKLFADKLNVSVDWLLGVDVPMSKKSAMEENKNCFQLTPEIEKLINIVNKLNIDGINRVISYAQDISLNGRYRLVDDKTKAEIINLVNQENQKTKVIAKGGMSETITINEETEKEIIKLINEAKRRGDIL